MINTFNFEDDKFTKKVLIKGSWVRFARKAEIDTETGIGWIDTQFLVLKDNVNENIPTFVLKDTAQPYVFARKDDIVTYLARYEGGDITIEDIE